VQQCVSVSLLGGRQVLLLHATLLPPHCCRRTAAATLLPPHCCRRTAAAALLPPHCCRRTAAAAARCAHARARRLTQQPHHGLPLLPPQVLCCCCDVCCLAVIGRQPEGPLTLPVAPKVKPGQCDVAVCAGLSRGAGRTGAPAGQAPEVLTTRAGSDVHATQHARRTGCAAHTRAHTHTHTHTRTHARTHARTHTHTHAHTHMVTPEAVVAGARQCVRQQRQLEAVLEAAVAWWWVRVRVRVCVCVCVHTHVCVCVWGGDRSACAGVCVWGCLLACLLGCVRAAVRFSQQHRVLCAHAATPPTTHQLRTNHVTH
jgi:hypothetical protein